MIKNKKGFTLAEVLIVVAIIIILVAISIPVFTNQIRKAKLAVDHSAIRDAYAIVQIANNLEEVEIDGTTYTFEEIDGGALNYVFRLSEDCSSLLSFRNSGNAYSFKERGMGDDDSPCPDCTLWDDSSVGRPMSKLHSKGNFVYIIYDKETKKLRLGLTL